MAPGDQPCPADCQQREESQTRALCGWETQTIAQGKFPGEGDLKRSDGEGDGGREDRDDFDGADGRRVQGTFQLRIGRCLSLPTALLLDVLQGSQTSFLDCVPFRQVLVLQNAEAGSGAGRARPPWPPTAHPPRRERHHRAER
ncbi:hypothetical protein GCM10010211_61440 [Streptomyces albospinus]|uniref:Uncharacterized protein n=1 Tax=Streptomyces albospinus TaxID=285515 RepID=A0ABQ2VHB5_9ACTN|nr:hypothetical protein GCM10010211_61440 [Streptomyces albospinus]